jgi:hypothetical protein
MKKQTIIILALLAMVIGSAALGWAMHTTLPEIFTIDKAQSKKAPVSFNHLKHGDDFDCSVCHHNVEKGAMDGNSCFECHGKDPDANDPSVSSAKENPFHIRCRGCHKEKGEGPTKCNDCHKS